MNRLALAAALVAATALGTATASAQRGHRGHSSSCTSSCCADSRHDHGHRYDRGRHGGYGHHDRGHRGQRGIRDIAASLEDSVDRFARSFDHALDRSRLNGTNREDRLNDKAKLLERQTDRLRDMARRGSVNRNMVDRIFESASDLDRFMNRARLDRRAEQDWVHVTRQLDRLARRYRIARWDREYRRHDRGWDRRWHDDDYDDYDRDRRRRRG